jgi:hypothetical protein
MESATIFTIFVDRQGKELTRVESFLPLRENMKIRLKEKKGERQNIMSQTGILMRVEDS